MPGDLAALRQARDGLVDHGHEDGGADVLLARALVEQGLNVRLGKDPAARGDGVDLVLPLAQLVHLRGRQVQERGHLVDEGARAAGAAAVHADLHVAGNEEDLRVLAAQFDHHVRLRQVAADGDARGVDLLRKGDGHALRKPHARRARHAELHALLLRELIPNLREHCGGLLRDLRVVPFIIFVQDLIAVVQNDAFQRCRSHIQTNSYHFGLFSLIGEKSINSTFNSIHHTGGDKSIRNEI